MTAKTKFCALDDSVYIGRDDRAYAFSCTAQSAYLQTIKSGHGGHFRFCFVFSLSYQRFIYSLFLLPFVLAAGYTLPKSLLRGEARECQCQAVLGSFFPLTKFVQGGGRGQ
ncbi:hypothetical protein H0G86_010664 [Trichoderma simmonsii]|uniref:Uncharacterized protein n=1 Tax=Trichoderma simmonsii TaxID=1491479 RepID=A0A8G0LK07_9HYPO|nr:hypothetical protein H0G86_010664 [Trichoderma simmonsii]